MPNIAKRKDERKRFLSWTFVIYPESAPQNWREILGDLMTPYAISPLHDKDKNADGEPKKPHWHILLSFHSVKSYEQIKEITDKLNGPVPQPCRDTRGMVRYFCHLDNPEKYQYDRKDIWAGGGFDLDNALKATATEENEIIDKLEALVYEMQITEYYHLSKFLLSEKPEWRPTMRKFAFHLNLIIKSLRNEKTTLQRQDNFKRWRENAVSERVAECSGSPPHSPPPDLPDLSDCKIFDDNGDPVPDP